MDSIIETKDLQLWYGEKQALHGINMDIPRHEITALIGPSGCGKSTFLKTLNRMQDLVPGVKIQGQVLYEGQNIYDPQVDVTWLRKRSGSLIAPIALHWSLNGMGALAAALVWHAST